MTLLQKIQNITTPYEWHLFPSKFSHELSALSPEERKIVMAEYNKKRSVLVQEDMDASIVYQVGVYHEYQAFTDDKRIVNLAKSIANSLWIYQQEANNQGKKLYQHLSDVFAKHQMFVEFFSGSPTGYSYPAPAPVKRTQKQKEIEVQIPEETELEQKELVDKISEIEYMITGMKKLLEEQSTQLTQVLGDKVKIMLDQLKEISETIKKIKEGGG